MPENEQARLNPQIVDVEIGIRELRKIKIYPLSMKDQLELTDTVIEAITSQGDDAMELSIKSIIKVIQDNIGKVLEMATDEGNVLGEISNAQAMDIAHVIFDVNYGAVSKNFKNLSEKMTNLFVKGGRQIES